MILLFFCESIAATTLLTSKKIIKARTPSPEMPAKNVQSRDDVQDAPDKKIRIVQKR